MDKPCFAMKVPFNGIPTIVKHKDDRSKLPSDHGREFLHGKLPIDKKLQWLLHSDELNTYKLPSPTNKQVLPSSCSRAAKAAPRVLPTVHPILPQRIWET